MVRSRIVVGACLGAALGLPLLALMDLGRWVAGLSFTPFDLFDLTVRWLPSPIVNGGLELMVGALQALRLGPTDALAASAKAVMAVALLLILLAALGALYGALRGRLPAHRAARGAVAGLGLWAWLLPLAIQSGEGFVEVLWALALSLGWGVALTWAADGWAPVGPPARARRRFLVQLGAGLAVFTTLGLGLGRLLRRTEARIPRSSATPAPSGDFVPVPGTRPELTPVEAFYRVSIKLDPPRLDPDVWRLEVGGQVQRPMAFTYADLTGLPAESFYATLECISNRVGGDLISTTQFTGVALRDVLDRAGVRPGTVDIKFTCADGYTESLPLEAALDSQARLCYAMDGAPLPPEHGFPLRLFAPNRFGMKNPKWITRLEAVGDDELGFWERRGWSDAAWVKLTAVIDAAQPAGAGELEVGGIAYAGDRGLSKVEVRVDEGEWRNAELKPALSPFTWVLWRARIPAGPGRLRLTVRATNSAGDMQTDRVTDVFPSGATGYHKFAVSVES